MNRLLLSTLTLFLLLPASCQGPRPLHVVRDRADHAFAFAQWERAAEEYGEIVARRPGDYEAQSLYGRSLLKLDRVAEARRALEIGWAGDPLHDETAVALAEAKRRQGEEGRLYQFLRNRAEALGTPEAWLDLADAANEMGDADSARLAIHQAIIIDNGRSAGPYLAAAELAEHLGNTTLAVHRLRQAYRINPHHPGVIRMIRELGEVPGPTFGRPAGLRAP